MSTVTYHKSHTFKEFDGTPHTFQTRQYQVGVYGILDNDSASQGNYTPQQIRSLEKKMSKSKDIKDFKLGIPITVTDESGLWEVIT